MIRTSNKNMPRQLLWAASVLIMVALDQLTKLAVVKSMELYEEITVIPDFFCLNYVRNKGAGLGILANARWLFMSVTAIVIVAVLVLLVTDFFKSTLADISLSLILAGGIGNMIDRIALGEVVDFFQFQIKLFDFIFNIADVFVTFGTVLFVVFYLFYYGKGGDKTGAEQHAEQN